MPTFGAATAAPPSTSHMAIFALIGAGVTALAWGIGEDAWGWLILAASAVTLAAGLGVMYGVHRFVAAYLLNIWFIIGLGCTRKAPSQLGRQPA
jgi:hypothetical protein